MTLQEKAKAALAARGLPHLSLSEGYGWIEWFGGKRPVDYNTHVDVITRGAGGTNIVAGNLRWDHADHPEDIFAYRVVSKPPLLPIAPPASCDGTRCPSRNNCLRHEEPGNGSKAALWARREPGATACDQYRAVKVLTTFKEPSHGPD